MEPNLRSLSDEQKTSFRDTFAQSMLPHIDQIVAEDGYVSDAISALNPTQKRVFTDIAVENAATDEYGTILSERTKPDPKHPGKEINPLMGKWAKLLISTGLKGEEDGQYLEMAISLSSSIRTAYHTDPFIEK